MAQSCFESNVSFDDKYKCLTDKLATVKNNEFNIIGFAFFQFLFVGNFEETILRSDPHYSEKFRENMRDNIKASHALLETLQRKLSIPLADLCKITQTDCAIANRLEQYWRAQTPAQAECKQHYDVNTGHITGCEDYGTGMPKDRGGKNTSPSIPLAEIKQRAAAKYPTDYEMQEYKIRQQTAAYIAVQNFVLPQVPGDILQQIKASAVSKYPDDYEMQEYKIRQQGDAYIRINNYSNPSLPQNVISQIMAESKAKYPTDYEMQEYKIKQQAEAYSRIK